MAAIQACVRLDPDRAPEQDSFVRSRATVLREGGGQLWVRIEEAQVATLIHQGLEVQSFPDADELQIGPLIWRPADEHPQPPAALAAAVPGGDTAAYWLVRFITATDKAWLQNLALAGAEAVQQIDASTSVWRMTAAVADAVRALPEVIRVGLFHPAYVAALDLFGLEAPVAPAGLAALTLTLPPVAPEGNLQVRSFDGVAAAGLRPALEQAGANVVAAFEQGFVLSVPPEAAAAVLSVPGLLTANLPTLAAPCNHNAGVILGTNQVRDLGTVNFLVNLDGLGEVGAVVDSGFDVGNLAGGTPPPTGVVTPFHPELAANMRLLANSTTPWVPAAVPDNLPHGTHVAGIVAGDGSSSGGLTRGMAPRAALVGLAPLPGNVRAPFDFAAAQGARVINNSWGSAFLVGVTSNRYTNTESRPVDRWCFDNPEVLVLFAAGNAESDTQAGGDGVLDARTLKLQATAKNALTVGASENLRSDGGWRDSYRAFFGPRYNHAAFNVSAGTAAGAFGFSDNANEVALFSDRGQVRTAGFANTGRIKPDVVAPGTNILSTLSQWVAQPPPLPGAPPIADPFYAVNATSMLPPGLNRNLHQILTGTSMATPMVSGSALLLRQYYRTRHAQLRRPLLLEGVPLPAAAPLPGFASRPSIALHPDGVVAAWSTPALAADARRIVAMRIGRQRAPVDAAPVLLQADVGEHAALQIATLGDTTCLLHRHPDGKMRLSFYSRTLALRGASLTLQPDARSDDIAPPALLAANGQIACVWPTSVGNGGFFQRFAADPATGAPVAIDSAAISLLFHDSTGLQRTLAWDGHRFAFCGVVHAASWQLQLRQIDAAGQVQGAGPVTLVDQASEIRAPSLAWDERSQRYLVLWCDARNVPGGEIWALCLDANAAAIGVPRPVMSVPPAAHMRRPQAFIHPGGGWLLAWEDDSQNAHFDLYVSTLDANAVPDGRTPNDDVVAGRRALRLTDSPQDTDGYAVTGDGDGFVLVYQNPDEVNADRIGIHATFLTAGLAFAAQEDPSTPLQKSGSYGVATLLDHTATALTPISAVWTGASWDILRLAQGDAAGDRQQWLRLTADGLPDARHGIAGVRERPYAGLVLGVELLWTGNDRRIAAVNDQVAGISVHFADADGAPIATFGAGGAAAIADTVPLHDRTNPQLGFFTQPAFTLLVAYGSLQAGVLHLRQQRLNVRGVRAGNPAELLVCDGVAAHQWFQFVNGEGRSIVVFHRSSGADVQVLCRRFDATGNPVGAEQRLSAAAGEARNGVIGRRPTAVNSGNREYGAAWQYRASAAAHWEIHFSRLDRNGVPMANPPVAGVVQPVSDFSVIDGTVADWDATRDAVEPQLVGTYTHEAWTTPPPAAVTAPEWSPCWGLAWIGVETDGSRRLYFTTLDENGRRLNVPQPPPNPKPAPPAAGLSPPGPAPILQLGSVGARVQDYRLVWNGRVFMLAWTEEQVGRLRQCVTLVNRHATQQAYDLPSAALLRATLINGATNITPGPLPDRAAGYGWGRVNLRQSLAPALPVTLLVRDDCGIGPGRTIRYHFTLPPGTALLRVTLNWTDPPGPRLVNHLHLALRTPGAAAEFRGNLWDTAAGRTHLSRAIANPPTAADNHEDVQTFKQIVLQNPAAGEYEVEVSAAAFPADPFNQQNLQPFALVFAGTGPEVVFNQPAAAVAGAPVY
jgi:hypothetical protein